MRQYNMYQNVLVKHTRGGKVIWLPDLYIVEVKGPVTYNVKLLGNRICLVHADQPKHDDSRDPNDPRDSGQQDVEVTLPSSKPERTLSSAKPLVPDCIP
jgi:hypothetical protein